MSQNHLIRGNLLLIDNPGLGNCANFATELLLAKLDIDLKLKEQKGDAELEGKTNYRTRISLRGNPGEHCATCVASMEYLIAHADGTQLSARSNNVIQYWKDNPEVLPHNLQI
jgi:hypothetical protein